MQVKNRQRESNLYRTVIAFTNTSLMIGKRIVIILFTIKLLTQTVDLIIDQLHPDFHFIS
ncbi:hypothetical protein EVX98_21390 [Escherichia coli]|nr:hypothetical protein [Escherichia coli]RYH72419.1 hypothetical protein EVX98_21390 [Escherichia coli]